MHSFQYFRNLHGRGYKRWQIDGAVNKRPRLVPERFWIRFVLWLFNFR